MICLYVAGNDDGPDPGPSVAQKDNKLERYAVFASELTGSGIALTLAWRGVELSNFISCQS